MEKLSKYERATLRFYQTYKDRNPSILGIIKFNARLYLLTFAIFAVMILIEYLMIGWWFASLLIAACFGVFLRDISMFRVRIRSWPMTREITDWDKVASKLEKDEPESAKET